MIRPQLILDLNAELIVDNFAGGGGASTGIELAMGRAVDIAINHDPEALALHAHNHPQTRHLCEDVFAVDPLDVTYGRPVGLAWFSPDCKHFSKVKGGKPRSKKIRGLAWVAVKWAATVRPRVLILENVEEFLTWGPLLPDGSPDPKRKGRTFRNFVARIQNLGYKVEWRELRACDYGAPTIRKRLFLIARCDDQPIVWPTPTHGKPGSKEVKARRLKPWRTAAECIDWSLPCPSIFERDRPLAEASLRRIARGLVKFVIESTEPFIVEYHSAKREGDDRVRGIHEPLPTQTTENRFGLVSATIVNTANSKTTGRGPNTWPVDDPARTITSANGMALVSPTLIQVGYGEREGQQPRVPGLDKPLGTVVASGQKHALVAPILTECANGTHQRNFSADEPLRTQCAEVKGGHFAEVTAFLAKHYTGVVGSPATDPVHTVTATDHNALVSAHMVRQFGGSVGCGPDAPAATITAKSKDALVTSHLAKLYTTNTGQPVTDPMHTVTSGGNHIAEVRAFLVKYYGNEKDGVDCRDPMHTVTAKDRVGLVTVRGVDYVITDIGMRMLQPHELFAAQGFPQSYHIAPVVNGKPLTKTAQVRMCGNSVCPPLAEAIVRANVPELSVWFKGEKKGVAA